jgi:vitamin-K-epoxide reductase (warfarin-sensitive)
MRFVLFLLAVCGVVVSVMALQVHYSVSTAPCSINEKWDCGIVNHSQFAVVRGIPVAAIGIVGYLALAWFALAKQRLLLSGAAAIGFAYSLYLGYIEKSVLGVWCLYCVISLGIIMLITILGAIWVVVGWVDRET